MGHNEGNNVPFFRPEVLAAKSSQWLGTIRLAQPISGWLVAGAGLAVIASIILFSTFGTITKKARVTGITVPLGGSIPITSATGGVMLRSLVSEGEFVRTGQALFEVSTERFGDRGEISALIDQQLQTRMQTLQSEQRLRVTQQQEKKIAITRQIASSKEESLQLDHEIELTFGRQALAQESVTRYQKLLHEGYVSEAQIQQKKEDLIDIAARLSNLKRTKLQLQANQSNLEAERFALTTGLATDEAQLERAIASLNQEITENNNRKANLITASRTGIVTSLTSRTGQSLTSGQVLATLIPQASPVENKRAQNLHEVHLYAPSRTAGFIAPGQPVLIRYQAYPYQKYGLYKGIVVDVSSTPFAPNELPSNIAGTILGNAQHTISGFNSSEGLYRIRVKLDSQAILAYGRTFPLKPGMTLDADVVQDTWRIWEWVAEPLLAMYQRL